MTIQYRFFTIPLNSAEEAEPEFNYFLRSQRILTVHRPDKRFDRIPGYGRGQ